MKPILDRTIHSKIILKEKFRKPYQTVGFVYEALNAAEKQIDEQFDKIEKLLLENKRLKDVKIVGQEIIRKKNII